MPATYDVIGSTTLGSNQTTITFNNIPGTYTDLKLIFNGNCSVASRYFVLQFNADTGTNYQMLYMTGSGGTASAGLRTSDTALYTNNFSGSSTTIPQLITVDILSYASSNFKTTFSLVSNNQNASGTVDTSVGGWRSTNAITRIDLTYFVAGGDIVAGSTATLFGIKAA